MLLDNKVRKVIKIYNIDSQPPPPFWVSLEVPTIGIKASPSEVGYPLEGRFAQMDKQEGSFTNKPPLFDGTRYTN